MKPLFVGESNPYGSFPEFALYPEPQHSAGGRLCRLVLRLDPDDYLERFDRVNLCVGAWDLRAAAKEADRLRSEAAENGSRTIVLLGAKVCSAFGLAFMPFTVIDGFSLRHPFADSGNVVRLPHPSGLSRAWGEPGAFERARATLRQAGVLS